MASTLAAMASLSDQAIVVGGGLAGMSAASTVLEDGGSVLLDKFHFRHSEGWSEEAWARQGRERSPGMRTHALIKVFEWIAEKTDLKRQIGKVLFSTYSQTLKV